MRENGAVTRTIVALNAHPDDEAFLMSGTLAKAAAAGHRVVLLVATDGDLGLTSGEMRAGGALGERRLAELDTSAAAIGAARVEYLGYADSGMGSELFADPPGRRRLVTVPVTEVARQVAEIVRAERADVLIGYDAAGGYGHRDHVHVHEIARAAAALTGVPLLEATAPRDVLAWGVRQLARLRRFPAGFDPGVFERAFTPRKQITHRIGVRRFAAAKRASMAAHASQAAADDGADRTLAAFLRVPRPVFDIVFGREWFVDAAHPGARPVRRDLFEGLG